MKPQPEHIKRWIRHEKQCDRFTNYIRAERIMLGAIGMKKQIKVEILDKQCDSSLIGDPKFYVFIKILDDNWTVNGGRICGLPVRIEDYYSLKRGQVVLLEVSEDGNGNWEATYT